MMICFSCSLFAQKKSTLPVAVQKLFSQMIFVEGEDFYMNSIWIDNYKDEGLFVSVSNFYAQKYEVDRELWLEVMKEHSNYEFWKAEDGGKVDLTKPVCGVSWNQAVEFCNKVSEIAKLTPCYDMTDPENVVFNRAANGFRLPTEAEWELMSRKGEGAYVDGTNGLFYSWYGNHEPYLHSCGLLAPNKIGLYDLGGNVWEWCWDYYTKKTPEFYKTHNSEKPIKDYAGEAEGDSRVIKGGSFDTYNSRFMLTGCNVTRAFPDKDIMSSFGFRVVRNGK